MTPAYDDHPSGHPSHRPETLGDARVDKAVARLDELAECPVSEHVEIFDDIHDRLRGALEEAATETTGPADAAEQADHPGQASPAGAG